MNNGRVAIVLATFNGSNYLEGLLVSIAGQTRRPDLLVVRDDGSDDGTLGIIHDWSAREKIPCQLVEEGGRLGPARSFLSALASAEPCDAYFFCDQDDVWLPHKIERACGLLVTGEGSPPMLVASQAIRVNETLGDARPMTHPGLLGFSSALFENVVVGCTCAVNANLASLLRKGVPEHPIMHDWWCYLLASATGTVLYDPVPTLLYRQHAGNVLGAGRNGLRLQVERLAAFLGPGDRQRSRQLEDFHTLYGAFLSSGKLRIVEDLLRTKDSWLTSFRVAASSPVIRQNGLNTLTTRLSIILRRY